MAVAGVPAVGVWDLADPFPDPGHVPAVHVPPAGALLRGPAAAAVRLQPGPGRQYQQGEGGGSDM